ncbi:MAG: ATP-binding protein [Polyangiaceae bacterium]
MQSGCKAPAALPCHETIDDGTLWSDPVGREGEKTGDEKMGEKSRRELIAERDLLGSALAESERLTAGILSAVPAGVVHVRSDGAVRTANQEALAILGLSYDELTDRYTTDFQTETVFEDGTPCPVGDYPVTRALVTGEAQPAVTIGVRRPDGEVSWGVFRAVPVLSDEGETTGAVVTILDITERKRAEQEREELLRRLGDAQRLEALGRLAGGIAHDFNNLLTVILGGLDLVRRSSVEQAERHVGEVVEAAQQASNLTRQLLAIGRRQVLEPEVLSVVELVAGMQPMLARLVGERIRLDVSLHPDAPAVRADPVALERTIVNLVVNAREAMEGGGTIRLAVQRGVRRGGEVLELMVQDDGAGITESLRPRIFEPFVTTKRGYGSGLGLATVKGMILQSGGDVELDSRPGQGATFRVVLPACGEEPQPKSVISARPPAQGGRILLVEDEPSVRRVVQDLLVSGGYEVLAPGSSSEAAELPEEVLTSLDLVLTDVVMPELTGPELAARLAERAPTLRVVYMSGHVRDSLGDLPSAAEIIQKPFSSEVLLERIGRLIAGARRKP